MKKLAAIFAVLATLLLSGCVVTDPYYVQPQPVYVQPQPVYVQPRPVYVPPPVYIRPPPYCYWVSRYDSYYRVYRNVRVCR
jgi:hypothetical protein